MLTGHPRRFRNDRIYRELRIQTNRVFILTGGDTDADPPAHFCVDATNDITDELIKAHWKQSVCVLVLATY